MSEQQDRLPVHTSVSDTPLILVGKMGKALMDWACAHQ
jgi:hypothetical protein